MKKLLKISYLQVAFSLLDSLNIFNKNSRLVKLKLKIGILLLMLKGYDAKAQIDIVRGTCYIIGPRYKTSYDLFVSDRVNVEPFGNNATALNFGYQRRFLSGGISVSYQFQSSTVDVGPYVRVFPVECRWKFKHFIGANYQFNLSDNHYNELNISTGLIIRHQRPINFEVGCTFTYTHFDYNEHFIRPRVGVHYYFVKRRKEK